MTCGGAIARVREADAQRLIARAPLLPAIGVQADAIRSRAPVSGGGFATGSDFRPFITASYELDFWGKNRAALEAATASAHASRYDRTTIELAVTSPRRAPRSSRASPSPPLAATRARCSRTCRARRTRCGPSAPG
jgi:hypothetical protein